LVEPGGRVPFIVWPKRVSATTLWHSPAIPTRCSSNSDAALVSAMGHSGRIRLLASATSFSANWSSGRRSTGTEGRHGLRD
jgi:hypothetical protein